MTVQEIAARYEGRKYGKTYRAKCPVHGSRGFTLQIFDDPLDESVGIKCYAGCRQDDVLRAVGLIKKDLSYRRKLTGAERAAAERQRRIQQAAAKELNRKLWTGINIERLASQCAKAMAKLMALDGATPERLKEYHKHLGTAQRQEWRNQQRAKA